MGTLKIRLFGAPTIELNGELIDPGRRSVTALCAYLAASETPRTRDSICALLWPERSNVIARANLRRAISALRACVGANFVDTTHSLVSMSPEVSIDVREFRTLVGNAADHRLSSSNGSPERAAAMEEAVSLYRGDFLEGFSFSGSAAFDDWMIFEAERLRDSLNIALDSLSRPDLWTPDTVSGFAPALEYAHRWLQMDGLNEAAHRRLMMLYALAGQRGAALKQFEACKATIARELGSSPDAETLELNRRIESGSLQLNPAEPPADRVRQEPTPEPAIGDRLSRRRRRTRILATLFAGLAVAGAVLASMFATSSLADTKSQGIPIAVLPLSNDSSDSRDGWFTDGMTDAIITGLAKIGALRVTSHTSVNVLASTHPSIPQVRSRLGVDYVVEGSVLKDKDRVRITAQLIDARSDKHVWAGEYEGDLADIIGLQKKIAGDISARISARLSTQKSGSLKPAQSVDPAAYEAYLLGAYELSRIPFDVTAAPQSLKNLRRSLAMDDGYAPAHAALANFYWGATQFGLYTNEEGMQLAEIEAVRAVELDEDLSDAHTVLGFIRFLHDFDWQRSEKEFQRAIALKPSSSEAHCWYGSLLCSTGRFDEAIVEVKKALAIDPLSLLNILNVAMRLYYARDYDGAIKQATIARDMESGFYMSHMVLGYALVAKGMFSEATVELETAVSLAGDGAMEPLAVLSYAYNQAGSTNGAQNAEARLEALGAKGISLSPLLRAYIPLGRGDLQSAMDLIEQAHKERDLNLAWNFQDPFFDPLRHSERFMKLRKNLKL